MEAKFQFQERRKFLPQGGPRKSKPGFHLSANDVRNPGKSVGRIGKRRPLEDSSGGICTKTYV
jgi:hypothetical protein